MDLRDFQGLTRYKIIIPLLYVISWICMFAGPSFFPVVYQNISLILVSFLLYKLVWVFLTMVYVTIKSISIFKRAQG